MSSSNPFTSGPHLPKITMPVAMAALFVTVLLIVFIMVLRYVIRRLGGRRRAWRLLRRELALTGKAFSEPVQTFQRHQREVRVLAEHLSDPRAHLFVRRALSAVQLALTTAPGAYCYAVRVGPYGGEVQLASRRPLTAPEPWQADENNPLSWYIDPDQWDALPTADGPRGRRPLPVTVGITSEEEDCVVLDFAAGPRMICVEGDGMAAQRLLYCLAAQLDSPAGGARVVMAAGVHAHLSGPRLSTLLGELEDDTEPAEPGAGELVVVCSSPTDEQERRLRALALAGRIICLALGRLAGHCWALRVDSRGRVLAAELGLDADSAALPRAVARSLREGARLASREERAPRRRAVPATSGGRPSGGGSGGGDGGTGGIGGAGVTRRHAKSPTRSTAKPAPRHSGRTPAGVTTTTGGYQSVGQETTVVLPPVVSNEPISGSSLTEPAPSERFTKGTSSAPR